MVVQHAASVPSASDTVSAYWRFRDAVTRARLLAWLPTGQRLLVDVSGPHADSAKVAAMAGHHVIRVLDESAPMAPSVRSSGTDGAIGSQRGSGGGPGTLRGVGGDATTLDFLRSGSVDGVIATDRALSTHLAAEPMVGAIARVLRPGGRVLACVDSLVLGMAMLAGQSRWAHLADLPQADVVLVPWPDGTITRCYAADQARELFAGAGLTVNWMRPLTVLSENVIMRALCEDPDSMPRLIRAELSTRPGRESPDEAAGSALMVAASKALPSAAGVLALAADATRGGRLDLQPALRDVVPAVDALAVTAGLDPVQRRQHSVPLAAGRVKHRLRAVVLRQAGTRVGGVAGEAAGRFRSRLQIGDRTVQLVAHLLQALTGDQILHSSPRLPWAAAR
jgi:SAM-dependent methyltransferase